MKRIFLIIALCVLGHGLQAQEVYNSSGRRGGYKQEKNKGFDASRLIYGGGLGLSFGTVTSISVSPIVGYRITDNFSAGIGLGYQYFRVKDFFELYNAKNNQYQYYDYKTSAYSGSVWARYLIWENIFAHAEYQHNIFRFHDYQYDPAGSGDIVSFKTDITVPCLLVGGGYRQPITENSSFVIMILYDVLQDKYSPYRNTVDYRIGFNIGF